MIKSSDLALKKFRTDDNEIVGGINGRANETAKNLPKSKKSKNKSPKFQRGQILKLQKNQYF